MDNIHKSGSKNSFAKEAGATQLEEQRKQPWKDAMVPEANTIQTGEGTKSKPSDVVDEGSWEMNMTA
jgi:hypothetical protein